MEQGQKTSSIEKISKVTETSVSQTKIEPEAMNNRYTPQPINWRVSNSKDLTFYLLVMDVMSELVYQRIPLDTFHKSVHGSCITPEFCLINGRINIINDRRLLLKF